MDKVNTKPNASASVQLFLAFLHCSNFVIKYYRENIRYNKKDTPSSPSLKKH